MTTPDDLTERTQLARIQEKVVNLYLQINRLLDIYRTEQAYGPETSRAMDTLTEKYASPLTVDILQFQDYELTRVQEAQESALRVAQRTSIGIIAGGILTILLATLNLIRIFRSVLFPLTELRTGVEALRRGALDTIIPVYNQNEVGLLASTLNEMSARLRQTLQGMEQNLEELRTTQDHLRLSEEHYRSLYNGVPVGLFRSTQNGQIIEANQAMVEMLAYPDLATLLTSNSTGFYVDPQDRLDWQEAIHENEETRHFKSSMRCFDGRIIWVRENSRVVLNENGEIAYYEGSLEDVTELKEAENAIQNLNIELEQRVIERTSQLEAANKELEAFSYSVSHDLRAPLRALDGYGKLLLEDYSEAIDVTGQEYIQRLRTASQRMGDLIDDLLMLSRITRRDILRTQVDLSDMAQGIASELQGEMPERRVEFVIAEQILAFADPNLIRIVLENLLGNAWKFTARHETARIEFGVQSDRYQRKVYYVRDDGAGFEMSYVHKLFSAFQRLHTADDFEGTGIGLATVQRIIHRHSGEVWAEGAPEKGATFYFTLPEQHPPETR